jgi:hypothetical protein
LSRGSESLKIKMPPRDFNEFVQRLEDLKQMGYVKTHRQGPTGIGKTLEDLLGIKENNVPGPNAAMIELKSARKGSRSMTTLVTKAPLPKKANSRLLQNFGYEAPPRFGKVLHVTLERPGSWTNIRGKPVFKIDLKNDRIGIVSLANETLAFWNEKILKQTFERKFPTLAYVKADCRGSGLNEEFWYNEAWLLKGFNFEKIKELIRERIIRIDIRIGQYPNGRAHDHGTGFRIFEDKFDLCFGERKTII